MTAHQEARNKVGLPLQQKQKSPATPVLKGHRTPAHFSAAAGVAGQRWKGTSASAWRY